jgi:hypothetical protein
VKRKNYLHRYNRIISITMSKLIKALKEIMINFREDLFWWKINKECPFKNLKAIKKTIKQAKKELER